MDTINRSVKKKFSVIREIKPDSIEGKLILNVADKLFIGVIAALVIFFAQKFYEESSRAKNAAYEITKIQTELIVTHRKQLTEAVNPFIKMIISSTDTGNISGKEEQKKLQEHFNNIRFAVFNLQAYSKDLNNKGEKTIQDASSLMVDVTSGSADIDTISEHLIALRNSYSVLLEGIRDTTKVVFLSEYTPK